MTDIMKVPMDPDRNDAGVTTVGGYMHALLHTLWDEEEGFSGKRPFGNSGWQDEVYTALVAAGVIKGGMDEDGYLERCDRIRADDMIFAAIEKLFKSQE